jgi:hypothetical protein
MGQGGCIKRNKRKKVIELKRFYEGVEVAIASVEIMEKNSKGQYQAKPIWFSPSHYRELRMGRFAYSEIEAEPLVKRQTIEKFCETIGESETL